MGNYLKTTAAPPPFRGGLDWDKIRADYRARLEEQAEAGIESSIQELAALVEAETPKAKAATVPKPKAKYSHSDVISMYLEQDMRLNEIADKIGAHRSTVSRILGPNGANVLPSDGAKGGPKRQDACQRGHEWKSEKDTYQVKGGGRGCRECKRARDRDSYQKRAAQASRELVSA